MGQSNIGTWVKNASTPTVFEFNSNRNAVRMKSSDMTREDAPDDEKEVLVLEEFPHGPFPATLAGAQKWLRLMAQVNAHEAAQAGAVVQRLLAGQIGHGLVLIGRIAGRRLRVGTGAAGQQARQGKFLEYRFQVCLLRW